MVKTSIKGQAVLAGLAAAIFGALTVVSAFRRDGASALVSFAFTYIMYGMTKDLIKESKQWKERM